jgi:diketogulonate reductase-like aldo/keto reductase
MNIRNFKSIRAAIMESFDNLGTDYIDLFLVHWPWPMYCKMYKELTKLYHEGRIRAIGVSSFTPAHIESLKEVSDVVPAVNQFEISPLNTQKATIKYCQQHGIAVEAMSTFSHFRSSEPRMEILNHPMLKQIAASHNKTVPQIVLRWLLQQDILLIPKTSDFTHLKENIDILDFELSSNEMAMIDSLDQGVYLNYNPNLPHITRSIPQKYRHL